LVGTDFNKGIKGVGPKTALKLIKKHEKIENLPSEYLSKTSSHFEKVREIYLNPETTDDYDLSYGVLNEEELLRFLCDQRNFSIERVETVIQRMKEVYTRLKQASLEKWFRGQT
jgi:flap endonuclease-1